MLQLSEKKFNQFYWLTCLVVAVIVTLRCIYVPFAHDEVATFHFYVQTGKFIPFLSHIDANGHFLTSALSWISFELFGSSPFALRLPSLIGFILLCYSIFRINTLFTSRSAKVIFGSAFILSFNFINFYSLSRGYGLSMSFLLLALYYFYKYIPTLNFNHLLKFILFSQLALSSNLTLVLVIAFLTGLLILFQIKNNRFSETGNILILIAHFSLLFFWIKYGFFLKVNGAFYAGAGDSYWKITFASLIETILFKSTLLNAIVVLLFLAMFTYCCVRLYKAKLAAALKNNFIISFFILCSLIIAFYLLKQLFDVNYPEERIGLFFHVFFIVPLCFMVNELTGTIQLYFLSIPLVFAMHFILNVNIRIHAWRVYETIPIEFFELLQAEQEKTTHPITIAGHRLSEFFYGFYNYNSLTKLNHITSPEAFQMNCDYALTYKHDEPFYKNFYSELATDKYWNFVLLKRRVNLEKKLIYSSEKQQVFSGNSEYYNTYEKTDTTFSTINPLLAEVTLSVDKVPIPFNAWLVVSIDCEKTDGKSLSIRVPLNLIKYDWNGTNSFTTCLVTGNIPVKVKRIVTYLWNIDKSEISIKVNSFKLYQLNGEGVTSVSPIKRNF